MATNYAAILGPATNHRQISDRHACDAESINATPAPHFSNINDAWCDVPDAFASPGWARYCQWLASQRPPVRLLRAAYRRLVRGADVPNYLAIPWRFMRGQACRVVDVGGGFGDNYALMPPRDRERITWHVVDNHHSIQLGRATHPRNPRLSFSANLAGVHDLALLIGTLQYVRDWRGLLAELARLGRPAIYIARSPLRREGRSFLTMQAICPPAGPSAGHRVGEANVTVIGREDLRAAMAAIGYRLEEERFDKDRSSDFARLPSTHRNVAYFQSLWAPS